MAPEGPRPERQQAGKRLEPEAGDEARTRDLRLGKPTLYQLSYARMRTAV